MDSTEEIAEWIYQQDWPMPWETLVESRKEPLRAEARSLLTFLDSLGFVQLQHPEEKARSYSMARYVKSILPAQEERCGAYAEQWKELGKPEGWRGCSLPKGHDGNHSDRPAQEAQDG